MAALYSRVFRSCLIYDIRDPALSSRRFSKLAQKCVGIADRFVIETAKGYVLPGENRLGLLRRHGVDEKKEVVVVRNSCHVNEHHRSARLRWLRTRRTGVVPVVSLLGYLERGRGVEWVCGLANRVGAFQVIAAGPCRRAEIRRVFDAGGNVQYYGVVASAEAQLIMAQSDATSLLYDPAVEANRLAEPNKFFESLMLGVPVLVSEGISFASEVKREGLGVVVRYGDDDSLLTGVAMLGEMYSEGLGLSKRLMRYFDLNYPLRGELQRYGRFYRRVLFT